MQKCKIILADGDLSYLSAIELLLLREYGNQIDLQLITTSQYLSDLFSEPQRIDIIVINEALWQEDFRRQDIHQVFLLSEDEHPQIRTQDNDILLYKYTSAHDVFASINIVLRRLTGVHTQLPTRLLMVYSPQGGSGKTTTAIGICCGLSNIGSKVLYINTETLQSMEDFLPESSVMAEDLIKGILTDHILSEMLKTNIRHQEFDYLLPMQYAMTSYGMEEKHFLPLIQTALQSLGYDFIVLDCSCDFTSTKAALMKLATFVVLPFCNNIGGLRKYQKFCQCINTNDAEKFVFVQTLLSEHTIAGTKNETDFPPRLCIPLIPGLHEESGTDFYKIQASNAFTELIYRFL